MSNLKALPQPEPLAKMAYAALRDSILSGRLQPGEIYNEMALAKELGISRTPVREALLELASKGLVTFLPRRGVMVNRFSVRDVEEIFEVREAIELALVEKVARTREDRDLSGLRRALEAQDRAVASGDPREFMAADRLFHVAFSELVDNSRLVAMLENVRDTVHVMGRDALDRAGRMAEVLDEHRGILEAVLAGDPARSREAMASHLRRSKDAVLEKYAEEAEG